MNKTIISYYAATLFFLVLDYLFAFNVRIAFLDTLPIARLLYYGVCFACLALMVWRPDWTVFVATIESLVTLIALIMSMALRSMIVTDEMLETGTGFVTLEEVINFVISGGAAYFSWRHGLGRLFGPKSR